MLNELKVCLNLTRSSINTIKSNPVFSIIKDRVLEKKPDTVFVCSEGVFFKSANGSLESTSMSFHKDHDLHIKTFAKTYLKNNYPTKQNDDFLFRNTTLQECHLFVNYRMSSLSDNQLQCFFWAMKEELRDYDYFVYSRKSNSKEIVEYVLLRCNCDIPLSNNGPHLDESIIYRASIKSW